MVLYIGTLGHILSLLEILLMIIILPGTRTLSHIKHKNMEVVVPLIKLLGFALVANVFRNHNFTRFRSVLSFNLLHCSKRLQKDSSLIVKSS